MYRPGEEVHVKGWIREVRLTEGADVLTPPAGNRTVSYTLVDSRGNELLEGTLKLNALGGFDTAFTLPETMNLGSAYLRLELVGSAASGNEYAHRLQVQEFRRPEFEVSASASEGPHFVGEHATTTVEAKYYAGGPLANADVEWNVRSAPGSYRPPNWDDCGQAEKYCTFACFAQEWGQFLHHPQVPPHALGGYEPRDVGQNVIGSVAKQIFAVPLKTLSGGAFGLRRGVDGWHAIVHQVDVAVMPVRPKKLHFLEHPVANGEYIVAVPWYRLDQSVLEKVRLVTKYILQIETITLCTVQDIVEHCVVPWV